MESGLQEGKIQNKVNTYLTSDLYLAVHLLCCGVRLRDIRRIGLKKAEFCFEEPGTEVIDSYYEKTKKFPTQEVLYSLKTLKNRVYNAPIED